MFGIASSFHEAANRCLPSIGAPALAPPPTIVCLAYACEIYLRTLLFIERKPGQGHMLDRLFHALSAEVKADVIQRYATAAPAHVEPISRALKEINHAYADWRSLDEAGRSMAAIDALWHLAITLVSVLLDKRPDLSPLVDVERLGARSPGSSATDLERNR